MEKLILGLIDKTKKQYTDDYSYMLRDFNQENETAKGYNGRQILELLQNCDDEGSQEVLIELDQEKKKIMISNNGSPFSKKGYRSLFIANLSSKTSQIKYIGNKGLGFRSVINWSSAIEIESNNLCLHYSEENRKLNFNEIYQRDEQNKIREEENLADNVIPMPFLTLPEVKQVKQKGFVTSISIYYKDKYLNDIIEQIESITPETILFLRNIEIINFKGIQGKENIKCTRESIKKDNQDFCPHTLIKFSGSSWLIFEKEDLLPLEYADKTKKDREAYQIKIAIEKDFKKSSQYLYSFFPTGIMLKQPYILHATFDLDANRNQINKSDKNHYILSRIVDFTVDVAKYYAKDKVTYRPLEILSHQNSKADSLISLGYYKLIEEAIECQELFPCIDNTYKTKAESIYASNDFAKILVDVGGEKFLPIHLLPIEGYTPSFINSFKVDSDLSLIEDIVDVINNIAAQDLKPSKRAKFIFELIRVAWFIKTKFPNKLAILTNDENYIIPPLEYIYTPATRDQTLKTPHTYGNIQFLNRQLYTELLLVFNGNDESDKARFITEQLKGYCNIHSYEPATLARKIISETRKEIEGKDHAKMKSIILEMNTCLFYNFKFLDPESKSLTSIEIPLINEDGEISNASDLILSENYPSGKITALIFSDIYISKDYISKLKILGLETSQDDISKYEDYLRWLGVNKYAKYRIFEDQTSGLSQYVQNVVARENVYNWSNYAIDYLFIQDFDHILDKISVEQLLLWINLDRTLKKTLDDDQNEDKFTYYYRGNKFVRKKPSYLKYYILNNYKFNFSEYLIDDKYSWVNEQPINYNHDLFRNYKITKTTINETLINLGATDDFINLPVSRITDILNMLPDKFPDGSRSQTLYKKALQHYQTNGYALEGELFLFANTGNELEVFPHNKVYFSEKIKLPKRLYKSFPIFNFPARAGGADAIKFFRINDLNEIQINITKLNIYQNPTKEFDDYFENLKPYILAQRLNELEDTKQQKFNATICSQIKIILCTYLSYEIGDVKGELSDYEYIREDNYNFYIKVKLYDNISSLRKNVHFTESFADIISMSFDVFSSRNEYKYMLRMELEDIKCNIISDFGIDLLKDARDQLGLSDHKQSFWEAVFITAGQSYDENMNDKTLEEKIKKELKIEFDVSSLDYERLSSREELYKIEEIFNVININLQDFNDNYVNELELAVIHLEAIKSTIFNKKIKIKSAIWYSLESKDQSRQRDYLNQINKIELCEVFAQTKANEYKYQFQLDADSLAMEYIAQIYEEIQLGDEIDIQSIYTQNTKHFTEEQLEYITSDVELKSLLHFPSSVEYLKQYISNINNSSSNEENLNTINEINYLGEVSLVPATHKHKSATTVKGVYLPGNGTAKKQKKKGDSVEEKVFRYLKENDFVNVDWISRDNEGLHYDIRYTHDKGRIKFVEVKSFDNGNFHLSREEYEFGKREADDYEIWLVRNDKDILVIKDFHKNPKFQNSLVVNNYKVFLEEFSVNKAEYE